MLNHLLQDKTPSILILTEHGLCQNKLEATNINGFSLIAHFSREAQKLGGVAIYSKVELVNSVQAIDISSYCQESTFEAAMVKVRTGKIDLQILGVYRTPGDNVKPALEILSDILELQEAHFRGTLIIGDINIDRLKPNHKNTLLEEELSTHNITRYPLPATRITQNTASSIDCVCYNTPEEVINAYTIHTGLSDHYAQLCELNIIHEPLNPQISKRRIINNQSLQSLKSFLSEQNWERILTAPDAEGAFNNFKHILQLALDTTCPLRKIKNINKKKQLKFHDNEARALKSVYLEALYKYEATGNVDDKRDMVNKKRSYDLKLRTLRQISTSELIEQSDNKPKVLWEVINNERKAKVQNASEMKLKVGDTTISDPAVITELLNKFFSEIADTTLSQNKSSSEDNRAPIYPSGTVCPANLILTPTTCVEVENIINSLKPKSSAGIDEFSSKMVKHCKKELTVPLVSIINKSFECGQFPSALKISKVYPKHKKGPVKDLHNYRPISLVSTFSKIIEKIVLSRLMQHMTQHSLLTDKQHGFLKNKSTTTALIDLFEFIVDQIDNEQYITAVFLDYSKAFDCLGHELLCNKLEDLGVRGLANKWFKSYLKDRSQIVELQHLQSNQVSTYQSSPKQMTRGVPQGSVLGPILFILVTNDFPSLMQSQNTNTVMYADDTTLLINNNTANEQSHHIKTAMNTAIQYSKMNDLAINPTKTTQIHFSTKKDQVPSVSGITEANQTKFLGIVLDSKLTWTEHIDHLCKKISTGIYVVRRIKWIAGLAAAKTAYFALVESHIRYGLLVWGGTSIHNLNRILLLQKKAVRTLANLEPRHTCRQAFQDLEIMTVVSLYILESILYVDKLHPLKNRDFHSYSTRHGYRLNLPIHRTSLLEKKPSYTGCKLRNQLPAFMKDLTGEQLRTALKSWLVRRPYYSVREFLENNGELPQFDED
jgi:hypothetical protein